MSQLTDELRADHVAIRKARDEVNKLGIGSDDGKAKLMSAKAGLLAHIGKEDAKLYPALHKAAETDAALKQTLNLFAKDMAEVSKAALDFFAKYAEGGEGVEFAKDYGKLTGALGGRIRREESMLYKKYDEIK